MLLSKLNKFNKNSKNSNFNKRLPREPSIGKKPLNVIVLKFSTPK
jgi:hypothetical protein